MAGLPTTHTQASDHTQASAADIATGSNGADANGAHESSSDAERRGYDPRGSCTKHFDALWFCYSPVYQMQEFYRYGKVDDCTGHWTNFYNCMKKKTKFAYQVKEEDPSTPPVWQLRSRSQAADFWREEFGHLEQHADADQQSESRQKTTIPNAM